jgi:hypothetical protein
MNGCKLQGTLLIDELGKPFLQLIQAGDEVPMPKISIVSMLNKFKIIIFAYICKHQKRFFCSELTFSSFPQRQAGPRICSIKAPQFSLFPPRKNNIFRSKYCNLNTIYMCYRK